MTNAPTPTAIPAIAPGLKAEFSLSEFVFRGGDIGGEFFHDIDGRYGNHRVVLVQQGSRKICERCHGEGNTLFTAVLPGNECHRTMEIRK